MPQVHVKKKLSGLFPYTDWNNPKRHISALVKGGKVVAYAECSLGGKPKCASYRGRSCHSEMSLLKYIVNMENTRKISKYIIWNIRWSKNGKIVNSKPCLHCQKVLLQIGIKTIIFSKQDGTFEKSKLAELNCQASSGFR